MRSGLPRNIYWLILLVIVFSGVGYYSWFLRETQRLKNLAIEAPATVTHTEVIRYVDPVFGSEKSGDIDVSFEYEIDGVRYRRTVRMSKAEAIAFIPWGPAKVCYDPSNPKSIEDAAVFPSSFVCGE